MWNTGAILLLLWGHMGLAACDVSSEKDDANLDAVEEIIADMVQPHEARPHGVPTSFDWALRPRLGMGNDPGDFRAFITWGQLYEAAEGNPAGNTRVQIRTIKAYLLLRSTNTWSVLQADERVEGAAYVEDFSGDASKPADIRLEENGISVTAGDGYNFHFWPSSGRVAINPDDIGGIVTSVEARLILDTRDGPDDRDDASYVLSVGADYWKSLTADWDQWRTNGDVGIGRFKYVRTTWRTMRSLLTRTDLQARRDGFCFFFVIEPTCHRLFIESGQCR